ncbi:MAG: hypothetical protein NTU44_02405, partial [Bacteroidetes bacterium]|nr:hypothetical protein [Bacteroidota bacterium]
LHAQLEIHQLKTRNLKLLTLQKDLNYVIPHTGRCFENSFAFHQKFWDFKPSQPVTVLFNDFSDIGNGGANVIPFNFITVGIGTLDFTFDILPANERMQWLMSHELTHIVMCDKADRTDRIYRKLLFGKIMPEQENPVTMIYSYLTTPRWYSPRWFHEGIATFMETWLSGGMGRVLGGYDEMVFRTMVKEKSYFYRPVGLESEGTTIDFQVGVNSYLYGTRFFSYLANTYGVEKMKDFCSRTDSSKRFFALQFKKVYKNKLSNEWEKWIAWETENQQKNLAKIKEYPITPFRPLLKFPLGSVSKLCYSRDERKVYAAVNYPKKMAHICSIDIENGHMEKITDIKGPALYLVTNIAYDDSTHTLFISDKNNSWRGLRCVNTLTGHTRRLIKYTRAGDFAFNHKDRGLYATQSRSGRITIVRFLPPYKEWTEIYHLPFGHNLFDLDVSPDGKWLSATMADVNGKQQLILFNIYDLLQGKTDYQVVYEFEDNSASNFTFSSDGTFLIGTSYYSGISNVFRIEIRNKKMEMLSNTETGFFRPCELSKDSLLVLEYRHDGLMPGIIRVKPINDANAVDYLGQMVFKKNPVVESWMLPPPSKVNIDSLSTFDGKYSMIPEMKLAAAYPILQGYKDYVSYGYHFMIADNIFMNSLKMNLSYSPAFNNDTLPDQQKVHFSLDYSYRNFSVAVTHNYSDFYDLFGDNKLSRAGYSVSLSYSTDITQLSPFKYGYSVNAAVYGDLEKLPDYQEIAATEKTMYSTVVSYRMSSLRKSLGGIEPEQGYDWKIYGQGLYVGKQFFPKIFTKLDLGVLLPMKNSAFWLKTAAGEGFAQRDNPFSNFYFGGFGYNYIDTKSGGRQVSRDLWGFPGTGINELGGKNFLRVKAEWNLPPLRFRKLGFLWFYITYARLSIFGSGIGTNLDDATYNTTTYNSGGQLDLELVLFSLLKSTLSAGYSRAYSRDFYLSENKFDTKQEWMITLRLL